MTPIEAANEVLERAKRATPLPWHWATSNSMRRLGSEKGPDGDVAWGQTHPIDKTADIAISQRNMDYSESAANHAPLLAESLRRALDFLIHMRYCQSCAEGSWSDCDVGKEAEAMLIENGLYNP